MNSTTQNGTSLGDSRRPSGWVFLCLGIIAMISIGRVPALGATASWYGEDHRGRLMANGQRFNPDRLTCASWNYPFGTELRVTHGQRTVTVIVTDRGPALDLHRDIDLSAA